MKFPIFVDGKETRFPQFETYDYKTNNNNIVLMMFLKEQEEIDFLIKEKKTFFMNLKDNYILLENSTFSYAFDFGLNIEKIKELLTQGIGIAFCITNTNTNIICDDFGLCFGAQL
jgi:hypothetical protein